MAINIYSLGDTMELAAEFIKRAKKAHGILIDNSESWLGSKESGAVRRISMELTRALADLRRSGS